MLKLLILILLVFSFTNCFAQAGNKVSNDTSEYAKINLFDEKGNWIHFSEKTTRAISPDNEKKFAVAYENCVIKKDTFV